MLVLLMIIVIYACIRKLENKKILINFIEEKNNIQ